MAKETAEVVARHLVATGRLVDDDPERALAHARAAGALAGRVGAVREAVGLAAYAAGQWSEALSELRAARRITGRADHLPVMADSERAVGRPERALLLLDDPDVPRLDQATRVELVIVAAGARRDMGQADAAVLVLQGPARATTARRPWAVRLWYAYADSLLAAGREDEAREWFRRAAEHDVDGQTDAAERLLEMDGILLADLQQVGGDEDEDEAPDIDLPALLTAPLERGAAPLQAPPEPPLTAEGAVGDSGAVVGGAVVGGAVGGGAVGGVVADSDAAHDIDGVSVGPLHRPGTGPVFSDPGEATGPPTRPAPAAPAPAFRTADQG